jgi:hypothetical protein
MFPLLALQCYKEYELMNSYAVLKYSISVTNSYKNQKFFDPLAPNARRPIYEGRKSTSVQLQAFRVSFNGGF